MKLGIVSDLHTEFWETAEYYRIGQTVQDKLADADVILMAGDIGVGRASIAVAHWLFPDKPVFIVAGNHEFYNGDYATVLAQLREDASRTENIKFLHKDVAMIKIADTWLRIIGTTLWTDFALHSNPDLALLDAAAINDFRYIRYNGKVLRPRDTLLFHEDERHWLISMLDEAHDAVTISMTHHAPVSFAIGPKYVGDNLSPCFASRLENVLLRDDLPLVVWGHTHHCIDRQIEQTRFVSNQTGYPAGRYGTETGEYGQIIEL